MAAKLHPLADRLVVKPSEGRDDQGRIYLARYTPKRNPRKAKSWPWARAK